MSNLENKANARLIAKWARTNLSKKATILDICAGSFTAGIDYDPQGLIYQPLVAQELGGIGYRVTALDNRLNDPAVQLKFKPVADIEILSSNWIQEVTQLSGWPFEMVIFLRSWDTPELLLRYQARYPEFSLEELNLIMAEDLLPAFRELAGAGGWLVTSEIFNLLENPQVRRSTADLLTDWGWSVRGSQAGLYLAKKEPPLGK